MMSCFSERDAPVSLCVVSVDSSRLQVQIWASGVCGMTAAHKVCYYLERRDPDSKPTRNSIASATLTSSAAAAGARSISDAFFVTRTKINMN